MIIAAFAPIANLKFAVKATEKVVAFQSNQYISDNNLQELINPNI